MSKFKSSKRSHLVEYAIRDIILIAKEAERDDLIYLNIGDPCKFDFKPPQFLIDAFVEAVRDPSIKGYAPSLGDPELRKAIADYENVPQDNVFVTAGLSEGIDVFIKAISDEGDYAFLEDPTYPLYLSRFREFGINTLFYSGVDEDTFRKQIEQHNPKFISIISPNNPTGKVYSEKELKTLINISGEYGIPIFYDGAYEHLSFSDVPDFRRLAKDVPFVYGGSMSKIFFYPGARLGYISFHGDGWDDIRYAVTKLLNARLCINWEVQKMAVKAYRSDLSFIKPMVEKLRKRRDIVVDMVSSIDGLSMNTPEGAFYAWISFDDKFGMNDWEMVRYLINEAGVVTVPSSAFGTFDRGFRIVFLPQEDVLKEAFERISVALSKL